MVVFGILLMVLGAISEWIVDNSVTINDKAFDMDALGLILLGLGALSVLIGLVYMAMATNTSHYNYEERDVVVEEPPVVEEKPVVVRRRKPRTKKGDTL